MRKSFQLGRLKDVDGVQETDERTDRGNNNTS